MASHIASDEKAQPDTALANDTQSNSETEDLAMGNQFAWTSSIFYVGQLASEFPFIYLMSRFRLSKFVGITM
ncbi:uncharacterized protein J4E84_008850 [Alternaria hordeiaustralica]|uniref:uncharacterized protein n=1 Tax=Alternaria hordeiaustralica TaxID=1187925 RepID=UPI0020C344B4|nr:uncharacterized protein J4E84_008850 [Alternaria hordeiaustralica]KAI4677905.1 hypothetical protein J4E84_008850 [Alternaria hordeiaustralica]